MLIPGLPPRQLQAGLAVLAVLLTVGTSLSGRLPSSADYFALLACAGLVAVCARFPILVDRTELSLVPALGISILFVVGLPPAAWTVLIGLLAGELWWFIAPGRPPTPERPARQSRLTSQLALQLLPLIIAGAFDNWLATLFPVTAEAREAIKLSLFGLFFLILYNALLALEVGGQPGAGASFFRDNFGAVLVAELLAGPLVVLANLFPPNLGASLLLTIGAVIGVFTLRLHSTSAALLRQAHDLAEQRRAAELAQQRAETVGRQLTVTAAKLELAQHESLAMGRRARHLETLKRLSDLLRSAEGRSLYDGIIRLVAEAVNAPVGQFGRVLRGGAGYTFIASYGLAPERAAHERNTVWLQEQGLPGRALRLGQPVRVGQVTADPDYVEHHVGMRSELCVPVMRGERRLGLLRLLHRQADGFSPEDEAFVVQAADLTALALENLDLIEEVQTRRKENAILLDTGVKLAASLDLRTVYRAIVQKLAEAVGADSCTLYEYDWSSASLRMAEPRGTAVQGLADFPSLGRAVAGSQSVLVQAQDPGLSQAERELLAGQEAASAALVPMRVGAQVVGLVCLYSRAARDFSASDLTIVQTLANQSAVALQNARLFHHVTEGRDRLAAILDSTREGVLVIDASGIISLVNPPLEEFWNLPSHRLLNQHLLALVDQPGLHIADKLGLTRDEIEELLLTLRAGLALSIPKVQFPVYQPKLRYLERTGAPVLDQFAKAIGWVVILRDVTEERELQHMRDNLANMIVHDLRSPLTSLLAGVNLLRDRLPKEQQTQLIKQSIDVAIRSGNRMLGLVNTLLDISRMESGELTLNRATIELSQVVDEVVVDLTPLANDQGVVLITEMPAGLPAVSADREKLSRVLTNLLDNALKFSPPGSQVVVRADCAPNGNGPAQLLCTVLDSGPGIPPEYLTRVFDRFVQVEGQAGRRQGTGLGLAFCKLAVEAHGGRIWVENRPEGGSAFYFALPVEH